jgi:hypothetical protein
MRTNGFLSIAKRAYMACLMAMFVSVLPALSADKNARKSQDPDTISYVQFKGSVEDAQSGDPLTFATLNISNSNIATVCNSEGEFVLKVPRHMLDQKLYVSFLGYKTREILLADLKDRNKIKLDMLTVSLAEINVFPKDPNYLIRAVMNKRHENYPVETMMMTAFYRETIKKGWTYVSLSEAVVEVLKQPYNGMRPDMVRMYKGRKSADYDKLDTLTFKLMGGPYSTLMLDMMKNPYLMFTDDMMAFYDFSLSNITRIDDRLVYVLDFKQKQLVDEPLFFGKLFVDSHSLAVTSASFSLNVANKRQVTEMMIRKKPAGADVYPTEANYLVNYREKEGKWFFGYARGQINFRVKWDRRLFNTNYYTTIEMAITDWEKAEARNMPSAERLRPNVIMQDAVSGFADKEFWGEYNVIEPEQSIDAAIRKIQKKLEK